MQLKNINFMKNMSMQNVVISSSMVTSLYAQKKSNLGGQSGVKMSQASGVKMSQASQSKVSAQNLSFSRYVYDGKGKNSNILPKT